MEKKAIDTGDLTWEEMEDLSQVAKELIIGNIEQMKINAVGKRI